MEYDIIRSELDCGVGWSDDRRREAVMGMLAMVSERLWQEADDGIALAERRRDGELLITIPYRKSEVSIRIVGQWSECSGVFEFRICSEYDYSVVVIRRPYFIEDVVQLALMAADRVADMAVGR